MKQFTLEVWGDLACFTRPELKVERLSYPVITPSAARGIFDAIYLCFGKNGRALFCWQVCRIELLAPINYIDLTRSEVKGKVSVRQVSASMRTAKPFRPILAVSTGPGAAIHGKTLRQTLALKNVRYRLVAKAHLYQEDPARRQTIEHIFERRARRGQCVRQPYLGCREFAAHFRLVDDPSNPPLEIDADLGWMLYDVFDLSQPNSSRAAPNVSLFEARLERGVLEVPAYESSAVHKDRDALR